MKQKVSPIVAIILAVVVVALIGGFYLMRNRVDDKEVEKAAKRGEATGNRMMELMNRPRDNAPAGGSGAAAGNRMMNMMQRQSGSSP